ncbi:hypothetical protein HGM15179_012670 [Zosterops borbonicus]|uniref:Retroviral nucleocapsid Gag protein p24 C-terminal domain-containing protein n=1 Tax=Zosterops borbonicus TaxID=364589 RepID=A0A8K1GA65_9PASS|nr:hypothetical protein HGM15179_012670 [Zosterops borbonicus]
MPLTDWGKVQTALADLPEAAARIFPVKKLDNNLPTYSPVNPKDVHAIAKAIAEKGINSAMVSTLIDGLFGNDDMLPFDIKQTCRLIFDGAGMIVFKLEWEDNLEKMLAKASGEQHPLRNSSLQRLMGRDPQMVSPQVQAQGLRASEVAATTRAAREAIRTACRVVAKPSPWTTIKQAENLPMWHVHRKKTPKSMPLTDWGKVQTALADLPEAAARIFPVKKLDNNLPTYSPVNPKDVHAIAKAIAEKGINSAMVSTLIDGLFGNDDMLPFDIKQTCRLIFDGAGMIVFKLEWEDNLEKMLAKASGEQHPLRNSSLQRLMGRDPQMVSPQVQAQGLRASEVAATTRAAREAIRTACRVVAKPSPWTTIKQAESERFTTFVDRLQAAIDASDLPSEAKGPVLEGCLSQQCNQARKELLRTVPPGASLATMIKHVVKEENLAPVQAAIGATMAPLPAAVGAAVAKVLRYRSPAKPPALFLCICFALPSVHLSAGNHPYQPSIWTFRNFITGDVIGQSETNSPAWTVRLTDIFTSDQSVHLSAGNHPYQPSIWTFRNFITGDVIGQSETNSPAWTVRLTDIFTSDQSVVVVPRILYHTDDKVMLHFEAQSHRKKRELVTAASLAVLLTLGGTGAATGISSLVTQKQNLLQLQRAIDEDLLEIHKNILKLEESLFSLSEMVLQNRRGLELLLMQQGGLCAALNEECCTYVNHSGPIWQSMAELKERLMRRGQEFQQQNWFDSLFNQHPWIAPIVSTLIGPVVTILLALVFGPCLLNKITQFVKARLSRIDIMLLEQRQLA